MDSIVKPVHQSCQGCCFSQRNNIVITTYPPKYGSTQVGCLSGYLDKFRKRGEDVVLEAENETGEFYIINGYKCPAFRTWNKPDLEKLRQQLQLKFDVFVLCKPKDTEESILETVKSFENQIVKPRKVYIVLYKNIKRNSEGYGVRLGHLPSKLARAFEGLTIDIDVCESLDWSDELEVLDRHLVGNDSAYYVPTYPGMFHRSDFLSRINSLYFDEFEKFIMVTKTPKDEFETYTSDVICTKLHHTLGGNKDGKTIQEKLVILNQQQVFGTEVNAIESEKMTYETVPMAKYIKEGSSLWITQK